ncbi:HAD family hydrolase [Gammaproteobacteria bacterium]|nr:HAD family hydrolase [Gammaproteobacteria bacterium]
MNTSLIPVFDLDDTLYSEITFVRSGFRAVADMLECSFDLPPNDSYDYMLNVLEKKGRGKVFDSLLRRYGLLSKKNIGLCLQRYRFHTPKIELFKGVKNMLNDFKIKPYIVTDGNKLVQANKIEALGLVEMVAKYYITHRYGIKNAKPSLHCFNLIKKLEGCAWNDIVYIGDNPNKDFVGLNKVGAHTIQVNFGPYADQLVPKNFQATHTVESILEINSLLERL